MSQPDLAEIRRALRDAPDVHPEHIFAGMPYVFRAERAQGVRAVYFFDISGEHGGTWTVRIADGSCDVHPGRPERFDAMIACDARTFLALVFGTVRPGEAFVDGTLTVAGDLALAMRFSKVMGG